MVVDASDLLRAYGRRCGMHGGRDEDLVATMVCDLAHWAAREDAMICTVGLPASADQLAQESVGAAATGHWVGHWRDRGGALDNPARAARISDVVAEIARRAGGGAPLVDALAALRHHCAERGLDFDRATRQGLDRFTAQMRGNGEIDVDALATREPVGYEDLLRSPELACEEWHALNRAIAALRAAREGSAAVIAARDVQADRARIRELFGRGVPGGGRCRPVDLDDDGVIIH